MTCDSWKVFKFEVKIVCECIQCLHWIRLFTHIRLVNQLILRAACLQADTHFCYYGHPLIGAILLSIVTNGRKICLNSLTSEDKSHCLANSILKWLSSDRVHNIDHLVVATQQPLTCMQMKETGYTIGR